LDAAIEFIAGRLAIGPDVVGQEGIEVDACCWLFGGACLFEAGDFFVANFLASGEAFFDILDDKVIDFGRCFLFGAWLSGFLVFGCCFGFGWRFGFGWLAFSPLLFWWSLCVALEWRSVEFVPVVAVVVGFGVRCWVGLVRDVMLFFEFGDLFFLWAVGIRLCIFLCLLDLFLWLPGYLFFH